MELVKAIEENIFPSIDVMSRFGLTGYGGTNPLDIFECYRTAVKKDGITAQQLEETSNLNELIFTTTFHVKNLDCYERVLQRGGIKFTRNIYKECPNCKFYGTFTRDCPNCGE